ncbi:MAG TPA: hypothetical protein VFF00_06805 [Candidatus Elarobacter sp.]|nr:hypothetical protein [Candidatus Elarobacter sp.]
MEAVEALTIVLAVGVARSWPVSLRGAAYALGVLALIVALFGPLLHLVPIDQLKLVVGIVLTLFGLAWLRKAILRYAGRKALRDEDAAFAREVAALRTAEDVQADRIGTITAFKAVLIEGLEVAIIVVTFGAASTVALAWSAVGAAAAVLLVALAGVALRRPASRVPENAMKFVVGVMLTSFGTFWTGEGLGIAWWGADLSLPVLAAFYLAVSAVLVAAARAPREARA